MTSPGRAHEILSKLVIDSATMSTSLPAELCRSCAQLMPMTGAAMVLQSSAGLDRVVAATQGLAVEVEELQFELGEGPGVDALRVDGPVLQSDLQNAVRRWPLFAPAAAAVGVACGVRLPAAGGWDSARGAGPVPGTAGPADRRLLSEALAYADAATAVLLHLQAMAHPARRLHPSLTGFTADRAEIHQATGMISAQAGVTLVEALLLLRARAYSSDTTMLALSRKVLSRDVRFGPDDRPTANRARHDQAGWDVPKRPGRQAEMTRQERVTRVWWNWRTPWSSDSTSSTSCTPWSNAALNCWPPTPPG